MKTTLLFIALIALVISLKSNQQAHNHHAETKSVNQTLKSTTNIVKAKDGDCYAPRQVNQNGVCSCLDRKNYIPQRNECICPKYAPFWNGQYCSGCPPGMDFNLDLGICYVCPDGFIRGYKIMTCMPGLLGTPKTTEIPADKASNKH